MWCTRTCLRLGQIQGLYWLAISQNRSNPTALSRETIEAWNQIDIMRALQDGDESKINLATLSATRGKTSTRRKKYKNKTGSHLDFFTKLPDGEDRLLCSLHTILAFIPGITNPHSKLRPVRIERDRGHWIIEFRVLTQPLLDLVVPDRHRTIRTRRSKRVVLGMERKSVDWPYMIHTVNSLAVALESVLLILSCRTRVEILDGNPALCRSSSITLTIGHTCKRARHVLERRFTLLRGRRHISDVIDVE